MAGKYKVTLVDISSGGEVEFDETTTVVNLMVIDNKLTAVLSERVFSEEEMAQRAQQAALMDALMRQEPIGASQAGFDFDFEDDDDDE